MARNMTDTRKAWLSTREALIEYFGVDAPMLENDFYFKFPALKKGYDVASQTQNQDALVGPMVTLQSFQPPQVGVAFNTMADMLWHHVPALEVGPMQISFYLSNDTEGLKNIFNNYNAQYNSRGTLSLHALQRNIEIPAELGLWISQTEVLPLVRFSRCKFTYPMPAMNPAGMGLMLFSSRITFDDYTIPEYRENNLIG